MELAWDHRLVNVLHSARPLYVAALSALACLYAPTASGDPPLPHVGGRWAVPPHPPEDPDYCWKYGAMHMIHLPTGKILMWYSTNCPHPGDSDQECPPPTSGGLIIPDEARLWDPESGDFTDVAMSGLLVCNQEIEDHLYDCSGTVMLADSSVLVAGGGCGPCNAKPHAFQFHPFAGTDGEWESTGCMSNARWYPTCTTLPDGKVLISSGASGCAGCYPDLCVGPVMIHPLEIYDPQSGTWAAMASSADMLPDGDDQGTEIDDPPYYPFMFVLPSGKVFFSGPLYFTYTLDLVTQEWTYVDSSSPVWGTQGSAVMYRPGKVLKCGGIEMECYEIEDQAAIIDLSPSGDSEWHEVDALNHGRKDFNLVLLADGSILAVGGQDCPDNCYECVPVKIAERYDPDATTPVWVDMAEATRPRGYHSTAMLLASGKVLSAGGENTFGTSFPSPRSAELYEPAYLFDVHDENAVRPVIYEAPTDLHYARVFDVSMPSQTTPPTILQVNLLRLGAVTHGFDQNQRFVPLQFCQVGAVLHVKAPVSPNLAPPGYYMLFILDGNGVPSLANYVRIEHPCIADLDGNCAVNSIDLGILLSEYTCSKCPFSSCDPCPCNADLNGDHYVNSLDLGILLAAWGDCPDCGGSMMMMMMGGGEEPPDQPTVEWMMQAEIEDLLAWWTETYGGGGD